LVQETGLAIGGTKFSPFVMLEVHLNNEKEESGMKTLNQGILAEGKVSVQLTSSLR
jgi:hypothetical protein